MTRHLALLLILLALARPGLAETTLFCLEGEFDLGGRYQGLTPQAGEFHALSWCVVTESSSERVHFTGRGKSNPDLDSTWTVAYLPPGTVRIVNRDAPRTWSLSARTIRTRPAGCDGLTRTGCCPSTSNTANVSTVSS